MSELLLSQAEHLPATTDSLPESAGIEREFYNMLMQAPAAILVLYGPQYVVEFANDLYFSITGRTPQELLQKPVFEVVTVASAQFFQDILDRVRSSGQPFKLNEHKTFIKRSDGTETIWLNVVYQPLKALNGAVERIMVLVTDVTEDVFNRQKQEAEEILLRKTKEQLELSISIGHIGVWHWDVKADVLTWSKEQLALYGIRPGEFGGHIKDFHRFVLPEDLHLLKGTAQNERQAGGDYEYQFRIKRTDGEVRWIQGRSRSFYNSNGEVEYRTGVNIDITEQKEAERSLQQSEERFRSTFDNAAVGIAHVSPDGSWLDVNERLCAIVGYTKEELLSSTFQRITHPDDLNDDLRLLQEVLAGERESYTLEKRYIHRSGSVVWINLTVSLVRHDDGMPKYFISVVEDIGERKRAEEKILESEERLSLVIEAASLGLWDYDIRTGVAAISEHTRRFYNLPKDEPFTFERFLASIHPADRDWVAERNRRVLFEHDSPTSYFAEYRVIRNDGAIRWMRSTGKVLLNENGERYRFTGAIMDVTDEILSTQAIQESEARYRKLASTLEGLVAERTTELQQSQAFLQSVLDTTQNGITTYSPIRNRQGEIVDFRISFINNMVSKDLGMLPVDITGRSVSEVFPQAFENGAFGYLIHFIETGEGGQREIVHKEQNDELYFHLSLARMDEGVTVTVRNITEQKRAAQQLEELNRQLQEINAELQRSNEDLQQFAHVASHDLKEPIRKVRTFGSRLEEEYAAMLPERGKLYLQKMLFSAERMFGLIDGVLNYSTINSLESSFEKVALNELIGHIESDLEVVLQKSSARINKENLPEVHGSPVLLNQLFYNLLTNALKFSKAGVPPLINIGVKQVLGKVVKAVSSAEKEKTFIQISICDNGIGFRPEHAEKIFKTFTRLNSRDRYEGTGLGLALCKKIVERHHGYIYATGSEGEGACFYVLLPV
ncbi:PAS domain S-box protein [Flavisolibacter ginsenosidimutans]|uniref:histidine kinase n=1 Tax=Flavisolibacter ginsenosidimutans TaxID=661481 RepID=A0A5B8UHS0_9BACT|nr:PAS domain S-box protein [Flavisolibacter ginsenosidimutans]QEC55630.1 PAS domain S-box protein [Flavisolibacter ginsenosidimutans]